MEEKRSKFLKTHIMKGFNTEEEMSEREETLVTTETLGLEVLSYIKAFNILYSHDR